VTPSVAAPGDTNPSDATVPRAAKIRRSAVASSSMRSDENHALASSYIVSV